MRICRLESRGFVFEARSMGVHETDDALILSSLDGRKRVSVSHPEQAHKCRVSYPSTFGRIAHKCGVDTLLLQGGT